MRVRHLCIQNFRGVSSGVVDFCGHTLIVGGNSVGKSTICEALDLLLGPERLFRRPVIDEHDFYRGRYLTDEKTPVEICLRAVLVDISDEAQRRFHRHVRRWSDKTANFVDEGGGGPEAADAADTYWALPIVFFGHYDAVEDDFVGQTFFDHPVEEVDEEDTEEKKLGTGRTIFGREQKRLCGFVFLRTLRTGARALSLQRGSLLDTVLRLGGAGMADMWEETLSSLRGLTPAIGDIRQLRTIRAEIEQRMSRFVKLSDAGEATAFHASDLTRDHLREVVRLFVAAQPGAHSLPFQRLGTGAINLLVFALLTFIADLKGKQSVIFAMEEPEIALPPHTQRRVSMFVLSEMGQAIITSHSPYVIEQFEPEQIVALTRSGDGVLSSRNLQLGAMKPKKYQRERRQMAEAVLSRAVLVVEGATEASLFRAASEIMERDLGDAYEHLDLAGITVFNAGADNAVAPYGPFFGDLGKLAFGFYDKQDAAPTAEIQQQLDRFDVKWESPEKGVERLLVNEMPVPTMRRFLEAVRTRSDYPAEKGTYAAEMDDSAVKSLAFEVLRARKGEYTPYASLLIGMCEGAAQLPSTVRMVLETMHARVQPLPAAPAPDAPPAAASG